MPNAQLSQLISEDRIEKSKSSSGINVTLYCYYLLLLLCASLLTNCNKNNSNDPLSQPDINFKPGPFKVTVLYRNESSASIKWSAPEDLDNDTLRYSVLLNGVKLDSNLLATTYEFQKLTTQDKYNGQIIAIDPAGDTSIATFSLPAFSGYIYFTSSFNDYSLNRLDIASGKFNWSFKDPGATTFQVPAFVKDTLFIFDPGLRKLHAINPKNSIAYWSTHLPTNFFIGLQTFSPVVYNNGKLFLTVDMYLLAFNSTDGSFIWKFQTNGVIQTNPTAVNDVVYLGCNDRILYAIDANTGMKKWGHDSGRSISWSSPTVADNTVFFVNETRLVALDASTGQPRWAVVNPASIESTGNCPRVIDGILYVTIGSSVCAFNAITGSLKWKQSVPGLMASNPAIDDNYLYIVVLGNTSSETIVCLERKTGQIKWKSQTAATPFIDPIVAHNRLFTTYYGYHISEIEASSGTQIKKFSFGIGTLETHFFVDINDTIYYPAISGMLQ
jgi:eukaryotic-like serine/threonine-protein kinase